MSSFSVSPKFAASLRDHRDKLRNSADQAMLEVMEAAQEDAQASYRWRQPGDSENGDWEWTTTGLAAESITGYVVSPRGVPGNRQYRRRTKPPTGVFFRGQQRHLNKHETINMGRPSPVAGKVLGEVVMYPAYAKYLQKMEIEGTSSGQPSAGNPVVVEVLAVNWATRYVPMLRRRLTQDLKVS